MLYCILIAVNHLLASNHPKYFVFLFTYLRSSFLETNHPFSFTQPESSNIFQLSVETSSWFFFSVEDKQCDYFEYLFSKLAALKEGQWKDDYEARIISFIERKKKTKKIDVVTIPPSDTSGKPAH